MTLISKATRASYIGSHNHKSLGKIIPRVDLSVSFSRTGATSKMKVKFYCIYILFLTFKLYLLSFKGIFFSSNCTMRREYVYCNCGRPRF